MTLDEVASRAYEKLLGFVEVEVHVRLVMPRARRFKRQRSRRALDERSSVDQTPDDAIDGGGKSRFGRQ
jgi:hypothetical protein